MKRNYSDIHDRVKEFVNHDRYIHWDLTSLASARGDWLLNGQHGNNQTWRNILTAAQIAQEVLNETLR